MKKSYALFSIIFLFVLLAACSTGKDESIDASSNVKKGTETKQLEIETDPVEGGSLYIADLNDAQGLDPHKETEAQSMRYIENMYNTLFKYEKGTYGEIEEN